MMQAADVLVLVAVSAHVAVHAPILRKPMHAPVLKTTPCKRWMRQKRVTG
jgi:hypothetical protein